MFKLESGGWSVLVQALTLFAILAIVELLGTPLMAQTTATWTGGAGNWSPCPKSGNALWNTCSAMPPVFPNGNFNAVIQGGPVAATSASVVNLTIGSGDTLNMSGTAILDITGPSIVNNGSIVIGSSNGLGIEGNITTTLRGSGTVTMTQANSRFSGGNGAAALINQQTISGQGSFGLGGLAITNQGSIFASGGELDIQPSAKGVINTGLIQAQTGSRLVLISGPFNNTRGTIKALNGSTILLESNISGGTIATVGTGNFTLAPPGAGAGLNSLTNAGTFDIPSGANLNWQGTINNTGLFQLDGFISTFGSVTLQGGGSVLMKSGQFNGVGTNPLTNKQLIHGSGTIFDLPLTNQGTIDADVASTSLTVSESTTINTAKMEASGGGILTISNIVKNAGGTIEALNASTVNLSGTVSGGTLTTSGTGTIQSQNATLDGTVNVPTNAGNMNVKNFDLFFQGLINNTGTISLIGNSCVILNQPSTLAGSGKLTMVSTSCIFGSGRAFTNQSTIMGSGSIGDSNPMPITNDGTFISNQAQPLLIVPDASGFTNNGKLIVGAGSTLSVNGLFNNLSTLGTLTGGTYMVMGTLRLQNSVVTNDAPITLLGASAQILNNATSTNALRGLASNAMLGSLSLLSGQGLATATNFTNAGKTTIGTGSSFGVGGSYAQTAGTTTVDGVLTAPKGLGLQGGILQGKGTVTAVFTSKASVIAGDSTSQAGQLTVAGSYAQEATGILNIAIGGTTVGTQYSRIAVSNGASINGTLNVKLVNGFVPSMGQIFTILTSSTLSGKFSTVNGLSINAGEHFKISYGPNAVTLTVGP